MCAPVDLLAPLSPAYYVNARAVGCMVYCYTALLALSTAALRSCPDFKNSLLDICRYHVRRYPAIATIRGEIRCAVYR